MGREQMRNIDVANVGGKQLNEFEYQKFHGEMTEQEHEGQQKGGGKRLSQAERIAQITAAAHKKVEQRRKKQGAKASLKKAGSTAKAGSKKSGKKTAKKTAKKSSAAKGKKKR